jgi:biopolymer transport protein TolR
VAFSTGQSGGSGNLVNEINVTPLVDVMLVLLIIFMVTAPLVQSGIRVDLPNAQAPQIPSNDQRLRITVAREDANNPASPVGIWIGRDRVTIESLADRLRTNATVLRDHEAYLQADESVPYGSVVRVMGIMRLAGVQRLGIVTDPLVSQ